jgi:hypothetical protein
MLTSKPRLSTIGDTMQISAKNLMELMLATNGQIFSVEFVKRTNGELRKMRCRTKVKKYLKGGARSYEFEEKGLVSVFDLQKMEYRAIPVQNVTKFNGQEVEIVA